MSYMVSMHLIIASRMLAREAFSQLRSEKIANRPTGRPGPALPGPTPSPPPGLPSAVFLESGRPSGRPSLVFLQSGHPFGPPSIAFLQSGRPFGTPSVVFLQSDRPSGPPSAVFSQSDRRFGTPSAVFLHLQACARLLAGLSEGRRPATCIYYFLLRGGN